MTAFAALIISTWDSSLLSVEFWRKEEKGGESESDESIAAFESLANVIYQDRAISSRVFRTISRLVSRRRHGQFATPDVFPRQTIRTRAAYVYSTRDAS